MPGKGLFIRFTARAFRKVLLIYVFSYFPFGFEGRIWDLIVSVPDHCLSFYLGRVLLFANDTQNRNGDYDFTEFVWTYAKPMKSLRTQGGVSAYVRQ